jgi:sec-independent protein translocase protein TatC
LKRDSSLSFWDHLEELRVRLLRSLAGVAVALVAGFLLASRVQELLCRPFFGSVSGRLALLAPSDGFIVQIKIALLLAVLIAAPFVALQLWGFIRPGLKPKERKYVRPLALISTLLFFGGVAFAWWILPAALGFLGSFAQFGPENFWSLKNYISMVVFLLLAFGVIFQLPLVMGVLMAVGLVPASFFRRYRRYAIVIIFVLAALATPTTDMLTMLLMAGPLILLYEISIIVGSLIQRKREAAREESLEASPSL